MNLIISIIIASVFLIISIILFYISIKQKKNLAENYTIIGTLIDYKRVGKYLYPIIEFKENGEKKQITTNGLVNYKPIKIGSEIKILKKENGKYLTDSHVKFMQYYAISLMLAFILFVIYIFYHI